MGALRARRLPRRTLEGVRPLGPCSSRGRSRLAGGGKAGGAEERIAPFWHVVKGWGGERCTPSLVVGLSERLDALSRLYDFDRGGGFHAGSTTGPLPGFRAPATLAARRSAALRAIALVGSCTQGELSLSCPRLLPVQPRPELNRPPRSLLLGGLAFWGPAWRDSGGLSGLPSRRMAREYSLAEGGKKPSLPGSVDTPRPCVYI